MLEVHMVWTGSFSFKTLLSSTTLNVVMVCKHQFWSANVVLVRAHTGFVC